MAAAKIIMLMKRLEKRIFVSSQLAFAISMLVRQKCRQLHGALSNSFCRPQT
jgi:hypothetical protein